MKLLQPILLLEMRRRAVKWLLLLVLGVMLTGISGCATNEPENASVRPWNAPQNWENGIPGMSQQHE
jgi:hypothetical protein